MEEQISVVIQEVKLLKRRVGGRVTEIVQYYFESLTEWSSWSKRKIYDLSFGILLYMKSLLELFSVVPIDSISNIIKKYGWVRQEDLME